MSCSDPVEFDMAMAHLLEIARAIDLGGPTAQNNDEVWKH